MIQQKKPVICLVPVTMKLFWQLYPDLEERTEFALKTVSKKLEERFTLISCGLVGDEEEAVKTAEQIKNVKADLMVVWESGYVASGIPGIIIKEKNDLPMALLITQRDNEVPPDMDYPRYMESTAVTSAMELGGSLARMNIRYASIIGHMNDRQVYNKLENLAAAAKVRADLKTLVMGMAGYPYPGMLDISVDEAGLLEIGVSMKRITLYEVEETLKGINAEDVCSFIREVKEECNFERVTEDDLDRAARLYLSLEKIILRYGLEALTVHDYECLSTVSRTVSDLALSYLENRHGLATGVEGDIPNCMSAFIARRFSGKSPMFVDWTMFDEKNNAIFLQHNGKADPAIVENPVLSPSAEPFGGVVGDAVVFEASGKPGPVTMVSMIYRNDGWHIFAAEGTALSEPPRPCRLNQMTVRVEKPVKEFLEMACDMGLGHHLNVGYGHFKDKVKILAEFLNIQFHTVN